MINPTEETKALVEAIRAGMTSLSEVQRSLGYVPEMLLGELAEDLAKAREMGLVLSVDPSEDAARLRATAGGGETESSQS